MIAIRGLNKWFGEHKAVDNLTLEVPAGQITGLLGPNGAGKTTALRIVTGVLLPDSGAVVVDGVNVVDNPVEAKRRLGFVPDSGAVYEALTGMEFLLLVGALHGVRAREAERRIAELMQFFDLGDDVLHGQLLGNYSKGMRRKVVITAALMHKPQVVLLDEPLDGLDASAAVGFKALLELLAQQGKTILYSSHVLDVVERVCHRVAIMASGRLLVDGTPSALLRAHGADTLEQLFLNLTGLTAGQVRAHQLARTLQ